MVKNEWTAPENKWEAPIPVTAREARDEPSENTLTGEEKKIFDAVFAGAIIGASLTALMFLLL